MPEITLLLTACIKVANPDFVKRNRTEERLNDYKEALYYWLTKQTSIKKIVFCDNSGYPLDELKELVRQYKKPDQDVEFLSYTFTAYGERGYGFGELDIYEHCIKHSQLVKQSANLALVSGRSFVANSDAICQNLPSNFDVVVDILANLTWADQSYYIVKTKLFLEEFVMPLKKLTNDTTKDYTERALAKVVLGLVRRDYRWYPMPFHPLYNGISGKKNQSTNKRVWSGRLIPNMVASWVSHWHYRILRTAYNDKATHLLDVLSAERTLTNN